VFVLALTCIAGIAAVSPIDRAIVAWIRSEPLTP